MAKKLTFEQLIPALKKWAGYLQNNKFSYWDLIGGAWLSGRLQKLKNIKYASNAAKWAMIDYMRTAGKKRRTRKRKKNQGKQYVTEYTFTEKEFEAGEDYAKNIKVEDKTYQKVNSDDLFEQLTKGFTKRDKLIIRLRYKEGFTLKEIGQIVDGTTESNISLAHKKLIKRLKDKIERMDRKNLK